MFRAIISLILRSTVLCLQVAAGIAFTLYHKLCIIPQDCTALQTEVMKDYSL